MQPASIKHLICCEHLNRSAEKAELTIAGLQEQLNLSATRPEETYFRMDITSDLDPDSLTLLDVLDTVGGQVPGCFFATTFEWSDSGETQEVNCEMVPAALASGPIRKATSERLLSRGALIKMNESDTLMVHPDTSRDLQLRRAAHTPELSMAALAAVCRAFPRFSHCVTRYLCQLRKSHR